MVRRQGHRHPQRRAAHAANSSPRSSPHPQIQARHSIKFVTLSDRSESKNLLFKLRLPARSAPPSKPLYESPVPQPCDFSLSRGWNSTNPNRGETDKTTAARLWAYLWPTWRPSHRTPMLQGKILG